MKYDTRKKLRLICLKDDVARLARPNSKEPRLSYIQRIKDSTR